MTSHRASAASAIGVRAVSHVPSRSARRRLAGALATALFAAPAFAAELAQSSPHVVQIWPVQTCDDVTGVGSLRYIAAHAQSGDTIDFSQLPTLCGMRDSTITLTAGEVVLHQPDITLVGPPPGSGSVTLSGNHVSRVLKHQVAPSIGTLGIQYLQIKNGNARDVGTVRGGCIYSDADVDLFGSSVTGCMASSETGSAYGGGIGQIGTGVTVRITRSTISGNTAEVDTNGNADGGGISAWSLTSLYGNFVGNTAGVDGGAVSARWNSLVKYSTFENNSSLFFGGAIDHWATTDLMIVNSTFSRNRSYGGGAINAGGTLEIYNSTIAFNSSDGANAGGINFNGSSLKLESTIVARNQSSTTIGSDIFVSGGTLSGAANAVMSSNMSPPGVITVTSDPMLAPLSWTGGLTRTHGPLLNSPAVSVGNNAINRTYDQRGAGFPRTTGPMTTVDIGAVQFDDKLFVSDFDQFFF